MQKYKSYSIMHKIFRILLKRAVNSSLSHQNRSDARVALAFSSWLEEKKYLEVKTESEAAREMGIAKEQLAYFCSVNMGKPFKQLRKEYRIMEAKRILKQRPGISLESLGEIVGIPDKSNFRRQFIEVSGCTPKEWASSKR